MITSMIEWINTKDELPEIKKDVLFIAKNKIGENILIYLCMGHRTNEDWVDMSEWDTYIESYEHEENQNVICWAYLFDSQQIAKQSENEYYKRINEE